MTTRGPERGRCRPGRRGRRGQWRTVQKRATAVTAKTNAKPMTEGDTLELLRTHGTWPLYPGRGGNVPPDLHWNPASDASAADFWPVHAVFLKMSLWMIFGMLAEGMKSGNLTVIPSGMPDARRLCDRPKPGTWRVHSRYIFDFFHVPVAHRPIFCVSRACAVKGKCD